MPRRRSLALTIALISLFGVNLSAVDSGTVIADWTYRGWIDQNGNHSTSNNNFVTGHQGVTSWRNFFVFDLGGLDPSAVVTGATFSVYTFGGTYPIPLSVHLYTGDPLDFSTNNPGVGVYNSMNQGPLLQSYTETQANFLRELPLENAFLQAIQDAAGGLFAFSIISDAGDGQYAFGGSSGGISRLTVNWELAPLADEGSGAGNGPAASPAAAESRQVAHRQMQAQQAAARRVATQQRLAQHRRNQQRR